MLPIERAIFIYTLQDCGVVIPTLGLNLGWLEEALISVCTAPVGPLVTLVTTEVNSEVEALAAKYGATVLQLSTKGVYPALNFGISKLPEEIKFFCFMGDDDKLYLDNVKKSLPIFHDPLVVAVYGSIAYVDMNGKELFLNPGYKFAPKTLRILPNLIPNPGTLIRISAWRELKFYDENLNWASDLDFFLRLNKIGKIILNENKVCDFRWHEGGLTSGSRWGCISESMAVRSRETPKLLKPIYWVWNVIITFTGEVIVRYKISHWKSKK